MKTLSAAFLGIVCLVMVVQAGQDTFKPNQHTGKPDNIGQFDKYSSGLNRVGRDFKNFTGLATYSSNGRMSKEDKQTYPKTPEQFYAIGDGSSHTLASLGITFNQAKTRWPLSYAAGLFDSGNFSDKENDWLAFNEAIKEAARTTYKVLLSKTYYVAEKTSVTDPVTIEGVSRWDSGLVAPASPYFAVLETVQYRAIGTSPHYAGGLGGSAHATFKNFAIRRNVKDWPNSTSSIGLQIGDGGSGYSYGTTVKDMVFENMGIGLKVMNLGHGHILSNNIYDFGVEGIRFDDDGTTNGLGDNEVTGNYIMGDSQINARDFSGYQGHALETVFGGVAARPASTRTAASYDIASKNQVAGIYHRRGGSNKFVSNKMHLTTVGMLIDFHDGIYLNGNYTEFIYFYPLHFNIGLGVTGYVGSLNATINNNELAFGRPYTDYSYFGKNPTGILIDVDNNQWMDVTISSNVFPSGGFAQYSSQNYKGIVFQGNSSAKIGGVTISGNTAYGLNVGIEVDSNIQQNNCSIRYEKIHNDDKVWPSVGGFTDISDANQCLTPLGASASGGLYAVQSADGLGQLRGGSDFIHNYTDGYFQFTNDLNSTTGAQFRMRKSKGGGAVDPDVGLFTNIGYGHDGVGYQLAGRSDIFSAETFTPTARGTYYSLRLTGTGGTTLTEQLRVRDGGLMVGQATNANSSKIVANGNIETSSGGFVFSDSTTQSTAAKFSSGTTNLIQYSNGSGGFSSNANIYKSTVGGTEHGIRADNLYAGTPGAGGKDLITAYDTAAAVNTRIPIITANVVPRMNSGATAYEASQIYSNATGVGIGSASTTFPLEVNSSADVSTAIRAYNTNTGTTANGQLIARADTSQLSVIANGSGRTATLYGVTIGGYSALTAGIGNGLLIGTGTTATPIVFGTNGTEKVRVASSGLITMSNGGGVPFGSMYTDTAFTVAVASANTWYEMDTVATNFTAGLLKNVTQSDHYLVATTAGYYSVKLCASLGTGVAGHKVAISTAINGTATGYGHGHTTIANAASTSEVCALNILQLAANDQVSGVVQNHSGAVNIDVDHAQMIMEYIGSP